MLRRDRDERTRVTRQTWSTLPRRSACRSLVPGQRGSWEEEGKEEEEEEAEDVEDSLAPVSALLLFVMSLTILAWVVSTAFRIWQSLVLLSSCLRSSVRVIFCEMIRRIQRSLV